MSSIFKQIVTPLPKQPLAMEERYSIESAVLEAEQALNDDIIDLIEAHREIDSTAVEITKVEQLSAGLDTLISSTIEDYSTSSMSPEAAALFRVSVESIFRASGVNIDLKESFASFESNGIRDVAAGAKSQVGGMLTQLREWLAKLWARLREIAATVVARLRTNKSSITNYVAAIENKLKRATKADPTSAEISIGGIADYLVDRSDRIGKPDSNIAINADLYGDFSIEWENHWRELMALPVRVTDAASANSLIGRVQELSVKATKPELDIRFILSHHLELDAGSGNNPLLGASIKVSQSSKAKGESAPTLTRVEIRHGLDTARSAIKVLEETERKIDTWISAGQRFTKMVSNIQVSSAAVSDASKLREAIRVMGKTSTLMCDGYLDTIPVYLRSLKANVRYIDLSVSQYL